MDWSNPVTYGVILAVGTTVGAVLWRVFWWVAKIDPLPAGLAKATDQFLEFATEIRGDIKEIFLRLPPPRLIESGSPARLTEHGIKLANFLQAEDWAAGVAATIVHEVGDKKPFQIEEFSREYVATKLEPEIEERVAACAYEFGTERDGVKSVLWVVLRDELLRRVEQSRT